MMVTVLATVFTSLLTLVLCTNLYVSAHSSNATSPIAEGATLSAAASGRVSATFELTRDFTLADDNDIILRVWTTKNGEESATAIERTKSSLNFIAVAGAATYTYGDELPLKKEVQYTASVDGAYPVNQYPDRVRAELVAVVEGQEFVTPLIKNTSPVTGISVSSTKHKQLYRAGDAFSIDNLTINVSRANSTMNEYAVPVTMDMVKMPADMAVALGATQTSGIAIFPVTVTYEGRSIQYRIMLLGAGEFNRLRDAVADTIHSFGWSHIPELSEFTGTTTWDILSDYSADFVGRIDFVTAERYLAMTPVELKAALKPIFKA